MPAAFPLAPRSLGGKHTTGVHGKRTYINRVSSTYSPLTSRRRSQVQSFLLFFYLHLNTIRVMACYSSDFVNNVGYPLLPSNQRKTEDSKHAGECAANDAGDAPENLAYDPKVSVPSPNRPRPSIHCYANGSERHYRSDLNNIANKYRLKLQYEDKCYGPPHDCYWTSTAYINEIPYASGQSRDKGGAREIASKGAVEALERGGYTI